MGWGFFFTKCTIIFNISGPKASIPRGSAESDQPIVLRHFNILGSNGFHLRG